MAGRLEGKRVLVTQADDYMGPTSVKVFRAEGAEVIEDRTDLTNPGAAKAIVEAAGDVDVLLANLAAFNQAGRKIDAIDDQTFAEMFEIMVYPLHRLVRAIAPQMIERKAGKVIVYGSASPLRGIPSLAAYSSARGAQMGYVRATGTELAPHNIQVNLIAQNWVESDTYFPQEIREHPKFVVRMRAEVPAGRLARPEEDVSLAVFLASNESDYFVGQCIPFTGGWVQ